jgi:hypothetical protein
MARALATPISRRRSLATIAGAVLGSSVLRPGRARGAGGSCPELKCQSTVGAAEVCVPNDWHCCSNSVCAGACKPWEKCSNAGTPASGCDDTPQLCTDPRTGHDGLPKFCSVRLASQIGICHGDRTLTYGWCCGSGMKCGATFGQCECHGTACGRSCCGEKEYCDTSIIGEDVCQKLCPGGSQRCNGNCCTGLEHCTFVGCSCNSGLVSRGAGICVSPKEDPGDPHPGWNPFRSMWNMLGESSARYGGHSADRPFADRVQTDVADVDVALGALAAVNAQGAAAMLAIRQGKPDPAFKHRVSVFRARPLRVHGGASLDLKSASALNKLLAGEAKANALMAAMATALWRARAAHDRHNGAAAKRQLRASAAFAAQAVTALKRVQAFRTAAAQALTAGAVAEVIASDDDVSAFIAHVRSSGIPSSLRPALGQLGVDSAGLKHLRTGVLGQTVTSASGPVLIAPLMNPAGAQELKQLIGELATFAARARKHPIAQ